MDRKKLIGVGLGALTALVTSVTSAVGWYSHPTGLYSKSLQVSAGAFEYLYAYTNQNGTFAYVDAFRSNAGAGVGANADEDHIGAAQDVYPGGPWYVYVALRVCDAEGCDSLYGWTGRRGFNATVDRGLTGENTRVYGTYKGRAFDVYLTSPSSLPEEYGYESHYLAPGIESLSPRAGLSVGESLRRRIRVSDVYIEDKAPVYITRPGYGWAANYVYANGGTGYYSGCGGFSTVKPQNPVGSKGC